MQERLRTAPAPGDFGQSSERRIHRHDTRAAPAAFGLDLTPCSIAQARQAVEAWHYLGRMQCVTVDQFAVHEDGVFIGAIVYGSGPRNIAASQGCQPREACELARVALTVHRTPVSRIVAISLRLLRARRPHIKLVVSYADSSVGHHGGIYQAGGWIYTGASKWNPAYRIHGVVLHGRTVYQRYGKGSQNIDWLRANVDPDAVRYHSGDKLRYLLAFDPALRARVAAQAKPYPKRAKQAMAGFPPVQRQGSTDPHAPHVAPERRRGRRHGP